MKSEEVLHTFWCWLKWCQWATPQGNHGQHSRPPAPEENEFLQLRNYTCGTDKDLPVRLSGTWGYNHSESLLRILFIKLYFPINVLEDWTTIFSFILRMSTVPDVWLATCRHSVAYSFMYLQVLTGSPRTPREVVWYYSLLRTPKSPTCFLFLGSLCFK